MGNPPSSLAVLEIPFGYMIASLLSLYLFEIESFLSIERLSFITLVGSLITSFVVAYRPIDRHFFPFLPTRFFKLRNFLYALQVQKGLPEDLKYRAINFIAIAHLALDSRPMDRPKGKIRSVILMMIVVGISALIFLVYPSNLLIKSLSLNITKAVGIALFLCFVLLLLPLRQEIYGLRLKLYLEGLYLLGAYGFIDFGSNFSNLEEALNKNDWPAAESWANRWFLEGKFFPRWPSGHEISLPERESFLADLQQETTKKR